MRNMMLIIPITVLLATVASQIVLDSRSEDGISTNLADENVTLLPLGIYHAETAAEEELATMLCGPENEIDLALANWLVAADLPAYEDMTREQYIALVDDAAARVAAMIQQARLNPDLGGDLSEPSNMAFVFCSAIIALGIDYKSDLKRNTHGPFDASEIYRDANNVFLAGLLRTGEGTCVSMPLLYLVIGERLDLPIHLVSVGQHFFIRWEEPRWRTNIETTIVDEVAMTPSDDAYLEVEQLTREQLVGYGDLKNLSKRSVVGKMFHARCAFFLLQGPQYEREYQRDLERARALAPTDRNIVMQCEMLDEQREAQNREQIESIWQRRQAQSDLRKQARDFNIRPPRHPAASGY